MILTLLLSPLTISQSIDGSSPFDEDYIESLPEDIREDVLKEMDKNEDQKDKNYSSRPSSQLSKNKTVRDWENFKKKNDLENMSERYGVKIFNTMQSSFMPLNEPNFGNNYVVDYGDIIKINKYGSGRNETFNIEIERNGTILLPDLGSLSIGGLNFDEASNLIKNKYEDAFIGVEVFVTLSEIRDINILITGNVEFPGIYTLSGNSNILSALNVVGGVSENGSLRNIILKRRDKQDESIDLYQALLFGDINNIPTLMSGDSIHVQSVNNLVRAGYGFNNVAVYELKNNETISDLIKFAGGLKTESKNDSLKLVRLNDNDFIDYDIDSEKYSDYTLNNLDSVYAYKEKIGTVSISGYVKHPGKYSISSSDRLLDLLQRSGGYIDSSYPLGGSLFRESSKELESSFALKTYKNIISYIAGNPNMEGSGGAGLSYILTELKNFEPTGRYIAEFDQTKLNENIQSNIYLNDGDKIHIPSYTSNVFIFGEVGNPGSVLFNEGLSLTGYINRSGGLTRIASSDFIFIVSPNGETLKVQTNGIKRFVQQNIDIYPGSVIYVPKHIGKIEGINLYATIAPIFSSLALSIASLNSINN